LAIDRPHSISEIGRSAVAKRLSVASSEQYQGNLHVKSEANDAAQDDVIVIRDLPKIVEFFCLLCVGLIFLCGVTLSNIKQGDFGDAMAGFLFLSLINIILFNSLRLSARGVTLQNDQLNYYVCFMSIPIFEKMIDPNKIYDLSSELQKIRADDGHVFKNYLVNISGESIQSVVHWSSRSSRDRFLGVIKYKFPHVRVHRFY
jgi:hypothetical protein